MQYLFREASFKGKIIRYIRAVNFDSDGLDLAPVNQLVALQRHIEHREPDTLVVVMAGRSSTVSSNTNPVLIEYSKLFPRQRDEYYKWQLMEYNNAELTP